jgi:hypothetical protein
MSGKGGFVGFGGGLSGGFGGGGLMERQPLARSGIQGSTFVRIMQTWFSKKRAQRPRCIDGSMNFWICSLSSLIIDTRRCGLSYSGSLEMLFHPPSIARRARSLTTWRSAWQNMAGPSWLL